MNELFDINGTIKPFLDWCKAYDASPVQVRALVSLGISLEAALQTDQHYRIVLFAMNGRVNPLSEWCRMYNVEPSTFKKRVLSGCTLREALEAKKHRIQRLRNSSDSDQEYAISKPFLEWCRDYGANPLQIRAAMSRGYSLVYALRYAPNSKSHKHIMVQMEGKSGSFLHFCSLYQMAPYTVHQRVGLGMTLEDALLIPPLPRNGIRKLEEMGRVNEVHSISQTLSDWCEDYRTSPAAVGVRLQLGTPFYEAVRMPSFEDIKKHSREVAIAMLVREV